jgi:alginate O-acetyltransferase complex protein AlgI
MLFNSLSYALFLPVVFIIYWQLNNNLKRQNILILIASYFFYACWSYKFLFLLIFSTLLDYVAGIKIFQAPSKSIKKAWLILSISINVGFLAVFKYYNFFIISFTDLLSNIGFKHDPVLLHVILPVGISFYTFHGLSYIIDVYNEKTPPERNFVNYSVFVSFFPLLVAGPIERAHHLLPQIQKKRVFNRAMANDGLRQILWGLFKKIAIADNCAQFADIVFSGSGHMPGSTLFLGAFFFAFQIYCDFSGYSDIAIGTAKLFGIDLLRNFAYPYFSRDMAEFWRRWHISLSSWFKDYLYIPLGGSKGSTLKNIRNIVVIFLVSGFWHGASFTFILWGLLNALFIIPLAIFRTNRKNLNIVAEHRLLPSFRELFQMLFTFTVTVFLWIIFRATDVKQAVNFISGIFSKSFFTIPKGNTFIQADTNPVYILLLIMCFLIMEWRGRRLKFALADLDIKWSQPYRWGFYYCLIILMAYFSATPEQFIYFQF